MQKTLTIIVLILTLALSALACNLPFMAPAPAGTPVPTDAGFLPPTVDPGAPAGGETPISGEPAAQETAVAALPLTGDGTPKADKELTVATTDSLAKSGLLNRLVADFQQKTGYEVKLELGGAGRAFRLGEKYVADVLLVNDPDDEIAYMNAGHGKDRILVMHADYVIAGPAEDPAGIKGATDAVDAFKKIAGSNSKFVTRDAEVDIIRLEKGLWRQSGITPSGDWYITATDAGTVGVLKLANDKKGYALTDRATFLQNIAQYKLEILFQGDVELYDAYHVITHDPAKSPKLNDVAAQAFVQYLLSAEVQQIIAQFSVDTLGQPIFFADGGKPE